MQDWNFKIKNSSEFKKEIQRLDLKFNADKEKYPKGKKMVISRLEKIKNIVFDNMPYDTQKSSFGNLLPFLEFQGGEEFLETEDGKSVIEVIFYFAYKWEPGDN